MQTWPNPFIEQRADPYILYHEGQYYFISSACGQIVWYLHIRVTVTLLVSELARLYTL